MLLAAGQIMGGPVSAEGREQDFLQCGTDCR